MSEPGASTTPAPLSLVCTYCGSTLSINTETVGPAYLTYERPESIECDALDCSATWGAQRNPARPAAVDPVPRPLPAADARDRPPEHDPAEDAGDQPVKAHATAPTDTVRLREIAQAAITLTPGSWEEGEGWVYTDPIRPGDRRLANVLGDRYTDPERAVDERARARANIAHIVAFSPTAALALIEEIESLRSALASVEGRIKIEEEAIQRSLDHDLWHQGLDYQSAVIARLRSALPQSRDQSQESAR